jgi:hypothetical protein
MKQKKGFILRDVCGDKVIIAEGIEVLDFGQLLSLNETAAWLWEEASRQGNFTIETLTSALCEEYNVEKDLATKDVTAILKKWKDLGLTEE